jgi:antirestriction protein ArdC
MTDDAKLARKRDLMDKLEAGVAAVQNSDTFKTYLSFASKFYKYSPNNIILIYMQKPEATHVAGFNLWRQLGRPVRKGEKGIAIFAPHTYKSKDDEESKEIGFHVEHVFDISQTDGEPVPTLDIEELAGDDGDELWSVLVDYARATGITLVTDDHHRTHRGEEGWYQRATNTIYVRRRDSRNMAKTLIHELAHHMDSGITLPGVDKAELETVAEGTAYVVSQHYGLDCGDYSFKYIASWCESEDGVKVIRRVMQRIQHNVRLLLTAIDAALMPAVEEPA